VIVQPSVRYKGDVDEAPQFHHVWRREARATSGRGAPGRVLMVSDQGAMWVTKCCLAVVSATRYDQRDFYLQSALGRSLSQIFSNFPVKRKIYFSNVKPLPVWFSSPAATFSVLSSILKSDSFYSGCQSEYAHIACVLPFGDEFRERIAFW
jgi:hypothetical protein